MHKILGRTIAFGHHVIDRYNNRTLFKLLQRQVVVISPVVQRRGVGEVKGLEEV